MEQMFKIKPYGKAELAQLYYGRPVCDSAARRWFMKQLRRTPGLMPRLIDLGLTPHNKIFTTAQVRTIYDAFGEP